MTRRGPWSFWTELLWTLSRRDLSEKKQLQDKSHSIRSNTMSFTFSVLFKSFLNCGLILFIFLRTGPVLYTWLYVLHVGRVYLFYSTLHPQGWHSAWRYFLPPGNRDGKRKNMGSAPVVSRTAKLRMSIRTLGSGSPLTGRPQHACLILHSAEWWPGLESWLHEGLMKWEVNFNSLIKRKQGSWPSNPESWLLLLLWVEPWGSSFSS